MLYLILIHIFAMHLFMFFPLTDDRKHKHKNFQLKLRGKGRVEEVSNFLNESRVEALLISLSFRDGGCHTEGSILKGLSGVGMEV